MSARRITVAELREYERELQGLQHQARELIDKLNNHLGQHEEWSARLEETGTYVAEKRDEITQQFESASRQLSRIHTFDSESKGILGEIKGAEAAAKKEYAESVAMREAIARDKEKLGKLLLTAGKLSKRVENLLPGAASAGLAHAFRERKEVFLWPKRTWAVLLAATLLGMFAAVFFDPLRPQLAAPSFGAVAGYLFSRFPFAVPIVWLAWYAARRHSQALRLEEDYAHKEALSRSFEGYKNQIAELEVGETHKAQTLNLIQKTLDALSADPGRVYRERNEDGTPFSSIFRRGGGKPKDNGS